MSEHVYEFQKIKQSVDKIADDTLIKVLDSKKYSASKTAEWIDKIGSVMVPQLRDLSPNFKYIISTVILQKTGAGLHSEVTGKFSLLLIRCSCILDSNVTKL